MKTFITTSLLGLAMFTSSVSAQDAEVKKPTQAEAQAVGQKFSQLLKQQMAFKDPEALAFAEQAKANNGQLSLNYAQMVALVEKWSTKSVGARFQKLLQVRAGKKDPTALKLMAKAQADQGKLSLSPEEMKALVEEWEVAEAMEAAAK